MNFKFCFKKNFYFTNVFILPLLFIIIVVQTLKNYSYAEMIITNFDRWSLAIDYFFLSMDGGSFLSLVITDSTINIAA